MAWQRTQMAFNLPVAGLVVLFALTACAAGPQEQGVACAAPSLFVAPGSGPTLVHTAAGTADLRRLEVLEQQGCDTEAVLAQLDVPATSGQEQRRLDIAEALLAAGRTESALTWFEQADSFAGYQRLLELHAPRGALADDAAYLRYEVKRAQLQQAFGAEVDWPVVSQAQPLFVATPRSALYRDTDEDSAVVDGLRADERVYLLDVVVLADGDSYWVQAYYPQTLALGWVPAETLAQYPAHVRDSLAALDQYQGRTYAQQLLFTALVHGMNLAELSPLGGTDFFGGAEAQQRNTLALLQRLGEVADACQAETEQLQQAVAHYLMDEGPPPQPQHAPYSEAMRTALAALTDAAGDPELLELRSELSTLAQQYFRIRVQGQIEQRLCHSLPNAAGTPEHATQTCAVVSQLRACVNRVEGIFSTPL